MALVVQKYGGTSVGDADRIRRVAARVARDVDAGKQVYYEDMSASPGGELVLAGHDHHHARPGGAARGRAPAGSWAVG